jgi:hypothetical protein
LHSGDFAAMAGKSRRLRTGFEMVSPQSHRTIYFCTVIVAEPVSGGLAESVAVTVMV